MCSIDDALEIFIEHVLGILRTAHIGEEEGKGYLAWGGNAT